MTDEEIRQHLERERQRLIWPVLRTLEEVAEAAKSIGNIHFNDFADSLYKAREVLKHGR